MTPKRVDTYGSRIVPGKKYILSGGHHLIIWLPLLNLYGDRHLISGGCFVSAHAHLLEVTNQDLESGKEDPLDHPYVILTNFNDKKYQLRDQRRKNYFQDKLNECMKQYLL